METGAANTRAARAFVAALARNGVRDACVTPGSRSTPLTLALAEQSAIKPWLHLDERASAFFATGLARATDRPVALVCTSGSAAANYLPAVTEANLSRIPLVVCTTDRPPHLRGVGAPQTMDQVGLYSSHVKWAVDLPLPGRNDDPTRFESFAARAVAMSVAGPAGPVHLNLPFDEPLVEAPGRHVRTEVPGTGGDIPAAANLVPAESSLDAAASVLQGARRPLIIAGPETGGLPAEAVVSLATALGAPIVADPLSGLRSGCHDRVGVVVAYDAVLRSEAGRRLAPDAILRFGAAPTSKALNSFLAEQRTTAAHVLCDLPGDRRDPDALATFFVAGGTAHVCAGLAARLDGQVATQGWAQEWIMADRAAGLAMRDAALAFAERFEGRVFVELDDALPAGSSLMAGNSMPIRDMDSFFAGSDREITLIGNRGVNGIDGITSSALGLAAGSPGPTVLVIGDISFYHDLSGLWAAKKHSLDLTIVLVNNDGGGIFHYLPQAAHTEHFENWWGTPPGIDFEHATRMFGGEHIVVSDWPAFRAALPRTRGGGLRVIELRTDRARNVEMHRQAWAAAGAAAMEALS